jgi:hypothetical protein
MPACFAASGLMSQYGNDLSQSLNNRKFFSFGPLYSSATVTAHKRKKIARPRHCGDTHPYFITILNKVDKRISV